MLGMMCSLPVGMVKSESTRTPDKMFVVSVVVKDCLNRPSCKRTEEFTSSHVLTGYEAMQGRLGHLLLCWFCNQGNVGI